MHKHTVGRRLVRECLRGRVPAVVALGTGRVRWRGCRIQVAVGRHVRGWGVELVVAPCHLDSPQHALGKVDGPAVLEDHLQSRLASESSVLLGLHVALDKVGPEDGLFHLHTGQGHEGRTEGHHRISCLFVVENHAMCRQVDPPRLLALELCASLVGKVHCDIVAEQQDAERGNRD